MRRRPLPSRAHPTHGSLPNQRVLGAFIFLVAISTAGCPWNAAGGTGCQPLGPARPLPEALNESSGVAWSLTRPGILYSHNDGNDTSLYALDQEGRLQARIPLDGVQNRDWEDMATARCGGASCIYIAETGDNYARWDTLFLYRIGDTGSLEDTPRAVEVFPMILPDGARDIEALFILPGEEVHLVSKGRHAGISVYRYPPPLRRGEAVVLEEVQTLSEGALSIPHQITGADASTDGKLVVIRSYQSLTFYQVVEGLLIPMEGGAVALGTLSEPQGEGVALGPDGLLTLSTEAGSFGGMAAIQNLRCAVHR